MINAVLIANRGEIACRIARTCRRLGIGTVAVHSDADAGALHVAAVRRRRAPARARRPPTPTCAPTCSIDAARRAGADAVHPGYGFLAESADFAQAVTDAGLTWIGPPPAAIAAMGSKIEAKALMRAAGVPVLPDSNVAEARGDRLAAARQGVGRRRRARACASCAPLGELDDARAAAAREAAAAFGDGTVFCERYVERGRHVEIQVFADTPRQRRLAARARVLDPAPAPEDRRGVAVSGRRRRAAPADGRRGGRRRLAPSATSAPAPSSSCSSRTAGSGSSR